MFVYKYTNKLNGKIYIGITTRDVNKRHSEHLKSLDDGTYFHNALKKYGVNNFKLKIIDQAESIEELKNKEKEYIKKHNSFAYSKDPNGYNCTRGGDGCSGLFGELNSQYGISPQERMDKETYQQWKENLNKSTPRGEDHRDYGKHPREIFGDDVWNENVEKARIRWSGEDNPQKLNPKYGKDHPNYGKKLSVEHKRKMQDARKENGIIKLSMDIANEIRNKYSTGAYSQNALAKIYRVSRGSVYDIIANKSYVVKTLGYDLKAIAKVRETERITQIARSIALIDGNNNVIKVYSSIKEASQNENMSIAGIAKHLKNRVKKPRYIYYKAP